MLRYNRHFTPATAIEAARIPGYENAAPQQQPGGFNIGDLIGKLLFERQPPNQANNGQIDEKGYTANHDNLFSHKAPYDTPWQGGNSVMDLLRKRESGGNYNAVNSLGYTGAYQFGSQALESIGLLKPGASTLGNKALEDENNWTIEGGKKAFLANKDMQDQALHKFLEYNKKILQRMGLITEHTSSAEVNAMLAAAHLGGAGSVKALKEGKNRRDAYGTPVSEYYQMGLRAT